MDLYIREMSESEDLSSEEKNAQYGIGRERSWLVNRTGEFLIRSGREIFYHAHEDANIWYLRSYLLGFVMAMLLHQRSMFAVHCSAVIHEGEATLITGESGSGKSTLTARFLQHGAKLAADDIAAVKLTEEGSICYPAFPFQKLVRDAALAQGYQLDELLYINEVKDKFLVPMKEKFEASPCPVNRMIYLSPAPVSEIQVRQLRGMEQLFVFRNSQFLHSLPGEWEREEEFLQLSLKTAASFPIYLVLRPQDGSTEAEETYRRIRAI
uniref:hypothetical protein n=1 Tax=Eubacterium cellulosolvens TaxID=29322 RepID=UPI00055768E3|nr:hypothetical protein [[Eubacterium] cellulosolvens]